jgi:hypothetical protein
MLFSKFLSDLLQKQTLILKKYLELILHLQLKFQSFHPLGRTVWGYEKIGMCKQQSKTPRVPELIFFLSTTDGTSDRYFFKICISSRFVKSLGSENHSLAFKRLCASRLVVAIKSQIKLKEKKCKLLLYEDLVRMWFSGRFGAQSTQRVAIAHFWRTFWWKNLPWLVRVGGARPPPFTLTSHYLPSRTKLQRMLQLREQIHSPYFISIPICTLRFGVQ